ncbi:hypothetical protein OVA29_19320 [Exiguobacterium sp. SL14]|nr:hypothetical protein [Exiguobacterium sp. SL14]MCY1692424.1 hypothetical protein [Exiguobacterium sp. SL14]
MYLDTLKLSYNNSIFELSDWIKFSFVLGGYIYENGIKNSKPIRVVVSLPNSDYVPLFVAIGIADKNYNQDKQLKNIKKTILDLDIKSRIIFNDNGKKKYVSVVRIEESPICKGEMVLYIQNGNVVQGVPDRDWLEKIIILNDEEKVIKRSRKVNKSKVLGLSNNKFLSKIYKNSQLNKASFYPLDSFYLVGNVKLLEERLKTKCFYIEDEYGSLKDFLYIDDVNSYTNGKIISSHLRQLNFEFNSKVPVIFSEAKGYLKQKNFFTHNPWICTINRSDNENNLFDFFNEIHRSIVQENNNYLTKELLEYLEKNNTKIPRGVEVMVWR